MMVVFCSALRAACVSKRERADEHQLSCKLYRWRGHIFCKELQHSADLHFHGFLALT